MNSGRRYRSATARRSAAWRGCAARSRRSRRRVRASPPRPIMPNSRQSGRKRDRRRELSGRGDRRFAVFLEQQVEALGEKFGLLLVGIERELRELLANDGILPLGDGDFAAAAALLSGACGGWP